MSEAPNPQHVALEDVEIRHVRLGDLVTLHELYESYVAEIGDPLQALHDNRAMVLWQMKRGRQQMLASQNFMAFIAWLGDQPVGYASGLIEEQAAVYALSLYGDLAEIYVQTDYRRNGIGRALANTVIEALEGLGVQVEKASAPAKSAGAQAFLTSLGFAPLRIDMVRRAE